MRKRRYTRSSTKARLDKRATVAEMESAAGFMRESIDAMEKSLWGLAKLANTSDRIAGVRVQAAGDFITDTQRKLARLDVLMRKHAKAIQQL